MAAFNAQNFLSANDASAIRAQMQASGLPVKRLTQLSVQWSGGKYDCRYHTHVPHQIRETVSHVEASIKQIESLLAAEYREGVFVYENLWSEPGTNLVTTDLSTLATEMEAKRFPHAHLDGFLVFDKRDGSGEVVVEMVSETTYRIIFQLLA